MSPLFFATIIFQSKLIKFSRVLLLLVGVMSTAVGQTPKTPLSVTFYGEEEPIHVWVDGKLANVEPQIAVTLQNPPPGAHEVSIHFADTSMRPIENYSMTFREGFNSRYKIKRKSIPYEKPKFFLQFFEEEPTAYLVQVRVKGISSGELIQLYAMRGDEMPLLAEARYDSIVTFVLPHTTSPGMLRLSYGNKEQADFIFNKENIHLSFDRQNPFQSLDFQQSVENQSYFNHLRTSNQHIQKMGSIYQLLATYPDKKDDFFQSAHTKFNQLQAQLDSIWRTFDTRYPGTFANALVQHSRPYFPEPTTDRQQYNRAVREHFFDYLKLDDPRLIHSSLYANKIAEYLGLWMNTRLEQTEQNQLFQQGVDALLNNASAGNEEVFAYTAKHVQTLFKQIDNEEMVFYIDNKWLANACEADELEKEKVQQRIEAYKQMQIGNVAPDFKAPDVNGKTRQLYAIKAPLKVLIFWASWCEHCQQEIPQLVSLYEQFKNQGVEFVAVSLDKDQNAWAQFVKEKQLNWLNVSELKGFDSSIANAYYIFKTPFFIVLDQENKIVNKPRNPIELQDAIRNAVK